MDFNLTNVSGVKRSHEERKKRKIKFRFKNMCERKMSSTRRINGSIGGMRSKKKQGRVHWFSLFPIARKNLGDIWSPKINRWNLKLRYQFHFVQCINNCLSIIGTFMFYAFIIASPPSHCLSTFADDRQQNHFFFFTYFFPFGSPKTRVSIYSEHFNVS